jgi:hypothetical protein
MEGRMKKLLCLVLSLLLMLPMFGCKKQEDSKTTAPSATEAPVAPEKPMLEDFGPWVLTAEYQRNTDKLRNYRYDESGALAGYGDYKATTEPNDLGGKTVKLVAYDADGNESSMLSKMEYDYNAKGQLVSYRNFEAPGGSLGENVTFDYDANGNMVKQIKCYRDNLQDTITYTYDGHKVTAATFFNSVNEATYSYVYDDAGVLSQLDFNVKYIKSGNTIKGSLALQKSVYQDDTTYRVVLSAGGASEGVTQGKEILFYEVKFNEQGKPMYVTLELKEWGLFQNGCIPMRQLGAMNATNWSGGSAKFVYKPLDVYLAQ